MSQTRAIVIEITMNTKMVERLRSPVKLPIMLVSHRENGYLQAQVGVSDGARLDASDDTAEDIEPTT